MSEENRQTTDGADAATEARRAFLKRCGKYAIVTPPAVSLMLSAASRPSSAGVYGKRNSTSAIKNFFKNRARKF